ncbi:DUF2231 domain-containing protein [Bacillus sp. EB600]|uniref:DUF2231 domain-containing protein n=1 Tax=Bacillus sp. EB600 TaxID=2806345 RepID=UPI00210B4BAF|nr:DUF2231 domain-containing protein [Bacillus sp. EB600]MCQ6279003.1 hypothetical protein [Bacillus sp. EB600]
MFQEVFSHIHPIMVHFPIALIIIATCYDIILMITKRKVSPKQGLWLWILAFLSAWIAVGTGPEEDARGNTNVLHYHSQLADVTTLIAFLVVAVRVFFMVKKKELVRFSLIVYCILALLCTVSVLSVGYFGGKMVYDQGVGVKMDGKYVNPPKAGFHEHD